MVQKHSQNNLKGLPAGLIIGAGGSIAVTLLLSAILAYLTNREIISEESARSCVVIILILSSAAGAAIAWMRVGHHKLPVCIGTGIVYYLILLACTTLFYGGAFRNMAVTALAILGGAGAIVLTGVRENKRGHSRNNRKHHNWKLVQNRQRGN